MASSDYLCCSVCGGRIVYADTMPGTFDTDPITAACKSCTADMVEVTRQCQAVLTRYLVPDGIDANAAVSELLGILDGPPAKRAFPMLFQNVRGEQKT